MIFQLLSVQKNGLKSDTRPRIQIVGDWLLELGFVNGALAQTIPEKDGFLFKLCNENINYSELYHSTREQGGTLIRVCITDERTRKGLTLVTTGRHILKGGLVLGDKLIAKCEYGCIKVRKISGNVRLVHVARTKHEYTGEPIPKLWLCGDWLNDLGFTADTLVTAHSEPNCITFTAHSKEIIYSDVVKFARKNKLRLIQVATKLGAPVINFGGAYIDHAEFGLDDILSIEYEQNFLKLQKFDPQKFNF